MTTGTLTRTAGWIVLLLAAAAAGTFGMREISSRTSVLPGEHGCRSLSDRAERTDCYAQSLARRLQRVEPANRRELTSVLAGIDADAAESVPLLGVCHQSMHTVGQRAGRRAAAAGTAPTFPSESARVCTAGYVHGAAEGYLDAAGARADVAAIFPSLCHDAAARAGCSHGMGHSLLRSAIRSDRSASVQTQLAAATDSCRALPAAHLSDCANGVYMEFAAGEHASLDTTIEACTATADFDLRASCFSYVPLRAAVQDIPQAQVLELCRSAGDAAGACTESLGRELGPEEIATCGSVPDAQLAFRCTRGALELSLQSGHLTTSQAARLCGEVAGAAARCRQFVQTRA